MLIKVREGIYNPTGAIDREETVEPRGKELWSGEMDNLTLTALIDAKVLVEPGTWYRIADFKKLISEANEGVGTDIYSTVNTNQSGVGRPWISTIEVRELSAVLMMCRSVVRHVEQIAIEADIWIRVE